MTKMPRWCHAAMAAFALVGLLTALAALAGYAAPDAVRWSFLTVTLGLLTGEVVAFVLRRRVRH